MVVWRHRSMDWWHYMWHVLMSRPLGKITFTPNNEGAPHHPSWLPPTVVLPNIFVQYLELTHGPHMIWEWNIYHSLCLLSLQWAFTTRIQKNGKDLNVVTTVSDESEKKNKGAFAIDEGRRGTHWLVVRVHTFPLSLSTLKKIAHGRPPVKPLLLRVALN